MILDEDVPYSTVVKNITAEEIMDMFKALQSIFIYIFLYTLYIQFEVSEKAWSNTVFTNSEAATGGVLSKKVFLEISP